jgi:formylglycine-generating enzyme required for sulfatase activity
MKKDQNSSGSQAKSEESSEPVLLNTDMMRVLGQESEPEPKDIPQAETQQLPVLDPDQQAEPTAERQDDSRGETQQLLGQVDEFVSEIEPRSGGGNLGDRIKGLPGWVLPAAGGGLLLLLLLVFWPSSNGPDDQQGSTDQGVTRDAAALSRLQSSATASLDRLRSQINEVHDHAELMARQYDEASETERTAGLLARATRARDRSIAVREHVIAVADLDAIEVKISYFDTQMTDQQLTTAFSELETNSQRLNTALANMTELGKLDAAEAEHAALVSRWQSFGLLWPIDPQAVQNLAEVATELPDDSARLLQLINTSDPRIAASAAMITGDFSAATKAWLDGRDAFELLVSAAAQQHDQVSVQIDGLLAKAELAMENKQLTSPDDDNALNYYRMILDLEPGHVAAQSGLQRIVESYHRLAKAALVAGNEALARQHAERANLVLPGSPTVITMQREIASYRQSSRSDQVGLLIQSGYEAEQAGDLERLTDLLNEARLVARDPADYAELEAAFTRLQSRPGRQFSDSLSGADGLGPEMVVMPVGEFTMGNTSRMLGAVRSERPSHQVNVDQAFAIAITEVTVGQFRTFVDNTGYQTDAERGAQVEVLMGSDPQLITGRSWRNDFLGDQAPDSDPVIYVSWQDASEYAKWLAGASGRNYRLVSESEFEFVLRAGSEGRHVWAGNTPPEKTFNLNGQLDEPPDEWPGKRARAAVKRYGDSYFGPAPAISFPANAFGVKHMLGNVTEWVADCYVDNYKGKGSGQQARQVAGCQERTIRGASWGSDKASLRASWRGNSVVDRGSNLVGFRVAVDLGQN